MSVIRWGSLTREELGQRAAGSVLLVPVGATEQHGPHLATCVDAAVVGELASRGAALAQASVVQAPTVAFGASHHHLPFGGTLSLSSDTLGRVLHDLCASAVACGFTRTLLLNGHGGNAQVCAQVAQDAARVLGCVVAAADYWALGDVPSGLTMYPGHAGEFEASVMLALFPEDVRPAAARPSPGERPPTRPGLTVGSQADWLRIDGFTDDPSLATAAKGEAFVEAAVGAIADAIDALAGYPVDP